MSQALSQTMSLKLHRPEDEPGDSYLFERRTSLRRPLSGSATAVLRTVDEHGARHRICSVSLVDVSDQGLGVMAGEELDANSSICILFPPHGGEQGFDMVGQVVRCKPTGQGYEVGIRLDTRAAA